MQRRAFLAALSTAWVSVRATAAPPTTLPTLPDGAETWLNSAPLTPQRLRGRPVLVEFWTFECINCRRTLPWMEHVRARYDAAGLAIVAVHTPEFERERDPAAVRRAVASLSIRYPVLLDADSRVWEAFDNHYWPATYLFDRSHRLAGRAIGELHVGEPRGDRLEAEVRKACTVAG